MKKIICAFALLAISMTTYIPARAEFKGTLQRDQPWVLEVDNSASTKSVSVTVFFLGRGFDYESITVQPGATLGQEFPKGRKDIKRITIEVDPSHGDIIPVRIVQGTTAFAATFCNIDSTCTHDGRLVFDVP
jgi:hypothetical protein